ncbi:amino acid adenylation domain-containing protein [Streptomyces fulvoviolaceus]|uniref:amino acid adenylation domain-containing protein n=1 Tax=Streptomyces fulvoviolaceus TaxID=285535 RepID=UPI0021BE5B53|nr:amino acid adenylation domain-containing protein [Streptomyces fulvoviolaceus]MCT9081063.1 amino acid adenylation domain-containing protein [Streptomyces fulvoviolaceus]
MQPDPRWNRTARPYPRGASVHGIVAATAAATPDAVCLVDGDWTVTYGLLDRASDAYAVRLAALGVGRGDLVPVRLPRGTDLVVTVLAVLKLGAAYALVDGAWPASRVADVLEQLDARVLVDTADGAPVPAARAARWSPPPGGPEAVDGEGTGFAPVAADGDDPCCVFFTSGTTGRPKGVLTPHRATVRLFRPGAGVARFAADTVMPQAAPVPWDGYSLELWSVLLNGGTSVVVPEPYLSPGALRTAVARHGVDTVWLTASLFNMTVDEDPDAFTGLRQVMTGGERLSVPHVRRFLDRHPGVELLNGYGPVESTVFATTHRIRPEDCDRPGGIPIGRPVPDTQVHVLDGDRVCAVGESGELCIAGDGLALRYLGRPELTAEKFTEVTVDGTPVRVYRTGDLAAWDEDGLLRYFGRADRQVKIRGHRVEPAEVERQIEALLPAVRRATVLALRDDAGACRGLAAFCLPARPGDPLDGALDTVRTALVSYHRPDHLLSVDDLPLTGNGKLDERALLALLSDPAQATPAPETAPAAASGDPLVDLVAGVFAEVLGRTAVPVDEEFTALGGTSLGAGRACARLSARLGRPVPLAALFEHPTAAALGARLAELAGEEDGPGPDQAPAEVPLTAAQSGFLVRHLLEPDDRSAHCLAAWTLDGDLDVAALTGALADVHARHPALHSAYRAHKARTFAVPGDATPPPLAELPAAPSTEAALIAVREALAAPLDPTAGVLWRAVLVPVTGTRTTVLGYVVHHIAFDGWSESVLAADLAAAYNARLAGRAPAWAPAPTAAQVWAVRERHTRAADLTAQRERLKAELVGVPELRLPLPAAGAGREVLRTEVSLSAEEVAGLDRLASDAGLTRFAVLLSRYGRALADLTGQDDFGVGVPVAQRVDPLLETAVGCHIGMVCVRLRGAAVRGDAGSAGRLVRDALACQDVGFDEAVRLVNPPRGTRSPLFQTLFALQDNHTAELPLTGAATTFHRLPYAGIPAEIQTEIWPRSDGGLRLVVNSRTDALDPDAATALTKTFADLIRTTTP